MGNQKKEMIKWFLNLFCWGIYMIITLIRTKVLLVCFGDEVNGITQAADVIFRYFVLLESGMSAACLFKMYSPMGKGDMQALGGYYRWLKKSMLTVTKRMLICLIIVSVIYAAVIEKVSSTYIVCFSILLIWGIRAILPYYITLPQKTLLNVFGYRYLTDVVDSIGKISIVLMEIALMYCFHMNIVISLSVGIVIYLLLGYLYSVLIERKCEYSKKMCESDNVITDAADMSKHNIVHQFAGLMNYSVDSIILSIVDVLSVTSYNAYNMIVNYMQQITGRLAEQLRTKVGISLNSNIETSYENFQKLLIINMLVAVPSACIYFTVINEVIKIWLGVKYCLSLEIVLIFSMISLERMNKDILYIFRDGRGLFKESKGFTLFEAICNLVLSVILVGKYGIKGILFATLVCEYLITIPCNAHLIYQKIFKVKDLYMLNIVLMLVSSALSIGLYRIVWENIFYGNKNIILMVIIQGMISVCVLLCFLFLFKRKWLKKMRRNEV